MEIKTLTIVTEEGKRNVKVANSVRAQMFEKIAAILEDNDFEVEKAANGELAIKTCIDSTTGETYFTRLAVSLSNKDLDKKIIKKAKVKEEVEDEIPTLFD